MTGKALDAETERHLLETLEKRFSGNDHRHEDIGWQEVKARLTGKPGKLWSLNEMEQSGGEPDVTGREGEAFIFTDCSKESPKGRRSICYDQPALEARKKHKPKGAATAVAEKMGIEILTESDYRHLQTLESFDLKTSSWIATPDKIRSLGGALFCDHRYETTFTYHNGADSYYSSRGFRGKLKV
ncbi:DUF4256 domain-containing protein [Lacicoccus alkaliphilus]|uniref:DUF4256 domain-containing protein n=1 Tax=Lacicoccus alkaliphilus DSM 16010 TaxID=1123231 RepID=A0A1M7E3Q1_9BACL|nr:DUF4256 domain-containing protein [Salinicoccus alkaliphilus]SHL86385.1 Protein of unknown function [Salinicoccus alkaliphilus DSM 16010]